YWVVSCAPFVVQSEVSHEARSNRCRKRKHFGCNRWGGSGECKVLSALRPCSNLYLASLYPPKPRLGSPRGRAVHYSVFRPKQSRSHRRWYPWLKSTPPAHVKKDGPHPTYALVLLKRDRSIARLGKSDLGSSASRSRSRLSRSLFRGTDLACRTHRCPTRSRGIARTRCSCS